MEAIKPTQINCRKCETILPFDDVHFTIDSSRRFGLKPLCRNCNKQLCAERRNRDPEATRENDRLRYANDLKRKQSTLERARSYYQNNLEKVKQNVKKRSDARKGAGLPRFVSKEAQQAAKERNRVRLRENYHRDIERSRAKERSRTRTEQDHETRKIWRQNNPGKIRANNAKRKGLLKVAASEPFTKEDVYSLRIKQNGDCFYCSRKMTAEGKLKETVDHIVPVSKGGTHNVANIVLSCWDCNMSKRDQNFEVFIARTDRPCRFK